MVFARILLLVFGVGFSFKVIRQYRNKSEYKLTSENKNSSLDNRESLPYSVFHIIDENSNESLGSFVLGASTACGDILDLGTRGFFAVKRVSYLYKFTKCGFKVYKKKLDVLRARLPWADSSTTSKFNSSLNIEERNILQ